MTITPYPLYENPYGDLHIDAGTVLELHAYMVGGSALDPYVTSLSPFVAKLQAYFRLFDISHVVVPEQDARVSPRSKLPFISVGHARISDSGLIIDHLKRVLDDPDAHLTPEQKAIGQVVQGTLEDHLYWIIIYYEFFSDKSHALMMKTLVGDLANLPAGVQEALRDNREDFRKRCYDQGIARFTESEIIDKAKRDLAAIDAIIGAKRFLLTDDRPTSYDSVVFGFAQAFFQVRDMHPDITDFARTLPNLGRFVARVMAEHYPELTLAFEPA